MVVFGGLPGVGKSAIAQQLVAQCGAVYLRIDTIEQALRDSGMLAGDVGAAGYLAAYALARSNLHHGLTVVADCVNPCRSRARPGAMLPRMPVAACWRSK